MVLWQVCEHARIFKNPVYNKFLSFVDVFVLFMVTPKYAFLDFLFIKRETNNLKKVDQQI